MGFMTKVLMIVAIIAIVFVNFVYVVGSSGPVDDCINRQVMKGKDSMQANEFCQDIAKMYAAKWYVMGVSLVLIIICALVFKYKD